MAGDRGSRAARVAPDQRWSALDEGSVATLAERLGIGHGTCCDCSCGTGASPLAVAHTRRLHFAACLLEQTGLPITQVALAAGFGSSRRFNDAFTKTYRKPPRELRRRARRGDAVTASEEVALRLAYRPPYDWTHLRGFLAMRALPGVERVDARGYARTVACDGGYATLCVNALPGQDALELRVSGAPPAALLQLSSIARRVFDLSADPARILAELAGDPLVGPLVSQRPGLRIPGAWDPFECAVRAVLGQQVSVAAGRTFAARLVAHAGAAIRGGADGLTHLFPTPGRLAAAALDGISITGARAHAAGAPVPRSGPNRFQRCTRAAAAALVAVPGIGA
jgi:AraC family transcriptional regulator of adaptative response / DNA-3-methyladenine glycosylase II